MTEINDLISTINGLNRSEREQLLCVLNSIIHDTISFDLSILELFVKKILNDIQNNNNEEYKEIIDMEKRTIIDDISNLIYMLNKID